MDQSGLYSASDDFDKTIIRPMPGGRKRYPASAERADQTGYNLPPKNEFLGVAAPGANPFIDAAFPLLSLASKLRILPFHSQIEELHDRLAAEVREFQRKVSQQGLLPEQIKVASYFICSLVDETVLNTPWGSESKWGHNSLLILFYNDAWGGEKFFDMVQGLVQQPAQNLHLIELAYLCLCLGFEGKYRITDNGLRAIEQLRQELYLLISRFKGNPERSLSIRWRGMQNLHGPIIKYIPLWVVGTIACTLLIFTFLGLLYAINRASDQVYAELSLMSREVKAEPGPPRSRSVEPTAEVQEGRFQRLLRAEIAQGKVEVVNGNLLRILNSFPAGSAQISKDFLPMLGTIAREVQNDTTRIKVIGHTDNKPIFTARFPSNWHLSLARAQNVAEILASFGTFGNRLSFEGIGDSEPIVANDSPEHLAMNRRIEIQFKFK